MSFDQKEEQARSRYIPTICSQGPLFKKPSKDPNSSKARAIEWIVFWTESDLWVEGLGFSRLASVGPLGGHQAESESREQGALCMQAHTVAKVLVCWCRLSSCLHIRTGARCRAPAKRGRVLQVASGSSRGPGCPSYIPALLCFECQCVSVRVRVCVLLLELLQNDRPVMYSDLLKS